MVLYSDPTSNENLVDEEVEVVWDSEKALPKMIAKPDPKIDMLPIQVVSKEDAKANDES